MSKKQNKKLLTPEILKQALVGSVKKLDPRYMVKNPVMFVVEIGFFITLLLTAVPTLFGETDTSLRTYNLIVSIILLVTVLFANFAESVAEGRGKAQAASLKKTQKDTEAHLLDENGNETIVSSSQLKKGDVVMVVAGEVIPGDGEVIEGIASVDESAITGESAPVVRESGGDVDTMILDKTGTITFGNRLAADFFPVEGAARSELIRCAALTSLHDETPEGKSTLELARRLGDTSEEQPGSTFLEFTAQTRMSGVDLPDGTCVRKGASDAIEQYVKEQGGKIPADLHAHVEEVSSLGGTPLVVCENNQVLGVIYLKDTVKPGMAERFDRLRAIGIKTIMCTGDNPLTAATIAKEAGVDGFIAECKPEDKISVIKKEQAEGKIVAMTGDGTNDAPALAQANVGLAMNSGTTAAKEAANMVDLDSDPTKILEVVEIGKQLLITRGSLTTFSIANDIAKYFAIIPAMFMASIPKLGVLNIMHLSTEYSAILSALIFNAIIIPCLIPLAMKGVKYRPMSSSKMLARNMMIYGLGGVVTPFVGIKLIDMIIAPLLVGLV